MAVYLRHVLLSWLNTMHKTGQYIRLKVTSNYNSSLSYLRLDSINQPCTDPAHENFEKETEGRTLIILQVDNVYLTAYKSVAQNLTSILWYSYTFS